MKKESRQRKKHRIKTNIGRHDSREMKSGDIALPQHYPRLPPVLTQRIKRSDRMIENTIKTKDRKDWNKEEARKKKNIYDKR
jgi:hypothetical protein